MQDCLRTQLFLSEPVGDPSTALGMTSVVKLCLNHAAIGLGKILYSKGFLDAACGLARNDILGFSTLIILNFEF